MITVKGSLTTGLKLGDVFARDFVIRPAGTPDMIRAEMNCPVERKLGYRIALAGQQLVSIGELQGPIDFDRMQELDPEDITVILDKQAEVEQLSKKSRSGTQVTSSPSQPSPQSSAGAATN